MLGSVELELQVFVSHRVGAENQTKDLGKSSLGPRWVLGCSCLFTQGLVYLNLALNSPCSQG